MKVDLGTPGDLSIEAYRVSIGLFHGNRKIPKKKIAGFHLICNAFKEILYMAFFMTFLLTSILKQLCISSFLSADIFSPLTGLLLAKKNVQ